MSAIAEAPDFTLAELRGRLIVELGETFAISTIHQYFRRHGVGYRTYGLPLLQENFELASDRSAQTYPVSRLMTECEMELRVVRYS